MVLVMARSGLVESFRRFKDERSLQARSDLAKQICFQFDSGAFETQETTAAKEILNILSRDIEVKIRKALAESLKTSRNLPRETALRLAKDIDDSVASPILEFSKILTDDDLEEIIQSTDKAVRLTAIAKRTPLSERTSRCLVDKKQEEVVHTLFANNSAHISRESYLKTIEEFADSDNVLGIMVKRGDLDVKLAEKIISVASDAVKNQISNRFGSGLSVIDKATEEAWEEVTFNIAPSREKDTTFTNANTPTIKTPMNQKKIANVNTPTNNQAAEIVDHLYKSKKLSHSIVLRALCRAELPFFEAGVAKLADIPVTNARKLMQGDSRSFAALFETAGLPKTITRASEILLKIILEHPQKDEETKASYIRKLVRIVMGYGYDVSIPNMKYFLILMNGQTNQGNTTSVSL